LNNKNNKGIADAALLLLTFNLFGRVLGFFREIIFANDFGLSTSYDIYLITSILPLTISTIFFYIIQNYFIPLYNKEKTKGKNFSRPFFTKNILLFLFSSIIITLILLLLKKNILSLYLGSNIKDFELIDNVFSIFIFSIPINVLFSVFSAYLQAEFEFKPTALAQIFLNVSIIFFVSFLSKQLDIYSIVIGYLVGSGFQLLYLFIVVTKKIKFRISDFSNAGLLSNGISSSIVLILIIESISQFYLISDRYFYSDVQQGGIAALNYSTSLYSLPIAIITVTLSTSIFPSLSELVVSNKLEEITDKIKRFINVNILIFVPISIVFFFWGEWIIKLILERGKFQGSATNLTYSTLKYYTLGLIPFSIYGGLNKLLYSFGWIKKLLYISTIAFIVKITFNFILITNLQQNGLALATSVSYGSLFLMTMIIILKKLKELKYKNIIYPSFNYLFSAFISFLCIKIFMSILIFSNSLIENVLEMMSFSALYFIILFILKDDEFLKVLKYFLSLPNKLPKIVGSN
jgi:putative peptidoglycan lipid II flippase